MSDESPSSASTTSSISSPSASPVRKAKAGFDLNRVKTHFQECYSNDLDMYSYIQMYRELNKMFAKFGAIFSIVTTELDEKTATMMKHVETGKNSLYYRKVELMLDFELNNNLVWLDRNKPATHLNGGCRTFLRLHRALNFVLCIIEGVRTSKENDSMATLVKNAYEHTLANFHPWVVRQGVYLAVYTLPTRKQVLSDMVGMTLSPVAANQLMQDTVTIGRKVYDACQRLYDSRKMLNLP